MIATWKNPGDFGFRYIHTSKRRNAESWIMLQAQIEGCSREDIIKYGRIYTDKAAATLCYPDGTPVLSRSAPRAMMSGFEYCRQYIEAMKKGQQPF